MPNRYEEAEDLGLFIEAYERATGERLVEESMEDAPDFVCRRANGRLIGVELTQIRRSPKNAFAESILYRRDEMDAGDALEALERVLEKKRQAVMHYSQPNNILMIASREADFGVLVRMACDIPIEDLESAGFEEIWLGDFQGVTQGAHREAVLFGLFPEHRRIITGRSIFDQKPYG